MNRTVTQRLAKLGLRTDEPPSPDAWAGWLERLAAALAHELNTPLATVRMNADAVRRLADELSSGGSTTTLTDLHGASRDMEAGLARLDGVVKELYVVPASTRGLVAVPPAGDGVRRVLVVDDEPAIGAAVKRVLRGLADVVVACSVDEAVAAVARDPRFDVVLCDMMMPGRSGMDLHHELARTHPALVGVLVFLTGGAFTEEADAFIRTCGCPCLAKPFQPDALRAAVRAMPAAAREGA